MEFVITGLDNWNSVGSFNSKNIAQELSRRHKVLFVNPPMDRSTLFSRERKIYRYPTQDKLEEVEKNIWVLSPGRVLESFNKVPFSGIFDFFNRKNSCRLADSIKEALRRLSFEDIILFNDNDIFKSFYLKELLRPSLSVYYMRDNFTAVSYWKRHGSRLEPELMKKSDLVLTNSLYYQDLAKNYNHHSYYIGQGCDFSLFKEEDEFPVPEDIKKIPRPLIGYVGAVSSLRLDPGLIGYLAKERNDWSIVLVGPADAEFLRSGLENLPNVYFLGSKKQAELPSYIATFNVAINPQKVNEITIGNYPRKVDEYLALGKSVVATRTMAMEVFEDYVNLAESYSEFCEGIEKVIKEESKELRMERVRFAKSHSWENSVNLLCEKVEMLLSHETAVS